MSPNAERKADQNFESKKQVAGIASVLSRDLTAMAFYVLILKRTLMV